MGTNTPWGISDGQKTLLPGIISYSTPSHGGIHVKPELNKLIHLAWRHDDGWYEEDLDWAIVAYHFPESFKPEDRALVISTLKNWKPYSYMKVTGVTLTVDESSTLREDTWKTAHKDHLQVVSAVGDWHENVPKGFVGVTMCLGGRLNSGQYASKEFRYFLVPDADYVLPFAIEDANKYQEVDKDYRLLTRQCDHAEVR